MKIELDKAIKLFKKFYDTKKKVFIDISEHTIDEWREMIKKGVSLAPAKKVEKDYSPAKNMFIVCE